MKYLLLVLLLVGSANAVGCFVPKPGYWLGVTDLVESSERIVVAELESSEVKEFSTENVLSVVEVIKGESKESITFTTYHNSEHDSSTYFNHWAPWFWLPMVGRSDFPCCICGPDFTFIKGEKYLLFPDNFGSYKSAEIISEQDAWYKYVKRKAASL